MPTFGNLDITYLNQEQTLIYVTTGNFTPEPTPPVSFTWNITSNTLYMGPSTVQGTYGNSNDPFIWGESFNDVPANELSSHNTLYLSSFRPVNDTFIVYVSVRDALSNVYINYHYIYPLHVHITENVLGVSAQQFYLDGHLSATNALSSNIVWSVEPFDSTYDKVWYSSDNSSWTQFDPTLLTPILSTNRYFQLSTTFEDQKNILVTLSSLSILPDSEVYQYTLNAKPLIVTTNITNSSISCDAYFNSNINYDNKWKILPNDGYLDFGIGATGPLQKNVSDSWISTTEGLRITAVNNNNGYAKQYSILLQIIDSPVTTAVFIPYIPQNGSSELIIESSQPEYINHNINSDVYFYQRINGIKSNLPTGVTFIKMLYTAPSGATLEGNYYNAFGEPIPYIFNGSGVASQLLTPLSLNFHVPEFSTGTPSLTTYTLSAQATFTGSTTTEISIFALSSISIFDWPNSSIFYCDYTVNYNPNNFWRQHSATDSLTVRDNSTYISGLSGKYIINWNGTNQQYGWPSITATGATSAIYPIANSEFVVTVTLSDFKGSTWNNGYNIQESIIVTYVDPFYDANFITYPTRRWDQATNSYITITDPITQSFGATAYGNGSIGNFVASATNYGGAIYKWYVDDIIQTENSNNLSYTFNTPQNQTNTLTKTVSCKIYDNSLLPEDMPTTYYTDTGILTTYINFKGTNDSDYLHQHLRMLPYDYTTDVSLTSIPNFYIPYETQITVDGRASTSIGALSAVYGNITWILQSPNWTYRETSDEIGGPTNTSFDIGHTFQPLVYGNGWNELTIHPDSDSTTLSVYITGTVFISTGRTLSAVYVESTPITINVVNVIGRIYTPQKYYTTNSLITVYNTTNHVNILTSYLWNDGILAHELTANNTQSWIVSYDTPGTYDLSFTTNFSGGKSFEYIFNNFVTIVDSYDVYSSEIFRTSEFTNINLPYTKDEVMLPPNEWIVSENVNNVFDKLQNNLNYLDKASKLYDSPPVEYLGWYGNSSFANEKWHINNGGDITSFISFFDVIPGKLYSVRGVKEVDNKLYVINRETILVLDNSVSGNTLGETDIFEVNDYFVDLTAIDVDSANRIFVLDKTRNLIASMEFNSLSSIFIPLNSWGGLGGPTSKYKFHSPTDMIIDKIDDSIWVVDNQNYAIKHYTNTGNWLNTIFMSASSEPISIGIDLNNYLHVLTNNNIVKKYTKDGTYYSEYSYNRIGEPKKIIATDTGFIYICFNNGIQRYLDTGTYSGIFDNVYGVIDYRSISYNSNTKNLYVSNIFNILKYVDFPKIIEVKQSYTSWPLSSIYIKPDEYVQDWVYNKSFSRLWESLEIFRRSLKGRIGYETETIMITAPYISARERLWTWEANQNSNNCITWDYLDCIINTYTWEQIQNLRNCRDYISYVYAPGLQILAYNKYTPTIFNFTPIDVTQLTWSKEEILIGINELVTYNVFNRCVNQLYDNEQVLFDMVK